MKAYELNEAQVDAIREALIIGLSSFGEIERLANEQEFAKAKGTILCEDDVVRHPTGTADVTAKFAEALAYLQQSRG